MRTSKNLKSLHRGKKCQPVALSALLHRGTKWFNSDRTKAERAEGATVKATQQDGSYPRPTMCRQQWVSLDGTWDFAYDDADEGMGARWYLPGMAELFDRSIQVPYPPESSASQIGDRGFHPILWYRRVISSEMLVPVDSAARSRVLIHFGAVDHRARVWCDGQLVATHVGGQTPFFADVTDVLDPDAVEHSLVVRAEDDPVDLDQPRGKQDWREKPHGIWYERTSGIWQPVWAETVGADHVTATDWIPDLAAGILRGTIALAHSPAQELLIEVTVSLGEEVLAEQSTVVRRRSTTIDIPISALRHGQDRARLLWTPEQPALVDIEIVLRERHSGRPLDTVACYAGLRSVGVGRGSFQLNEQPYYIRAVLSQGYRPDTHWASTGSAELRREIELAKSMGFNAVRTHQKAEDPRFLHWADRLGLLVWAETAAAYDFSPTAVELLVGEWLEIVRRDRSHPAVMAWVPINESWGVQDIASSAAEQQYSQALVSLTRALDPHRPVISNDGWEHVDSDILGLHDYASDPAVLRARYADKDTLIKEFALGVGPQGRRPILRESQLQAFRNGDAPLMITEFGGISLSTDRDAWGYAEVSSDSEYAALLLHLFEALRASPVVTGFCYTQLMDTGQETNGLLFADGTPKLPIEALHHIVTGSKDGGDVAPGSTFGWTG